LVDKKRDLFRSLDNIIIFIGLAEGALDLTLNDKVSEFVIRTLDHFCLDALFAGSLSATDHRDWHPFIKVEP